VADRVDFGLSPAPGRLEVEIELRSPGQLGEETLENR
jgi:hypothetical protein